MSEQLGHAIVNGASIDGMTSAELDEFRQAINDGFARNPNGFWLGLGERGSDDASPVVVWLHPATAKIELSYGRRLVED